MTKKKPNKATREEKDAQIKYYGELDK